jgi:predicted acetyltransferase
MDEVLDLVLTQMLDVRKFFHAHGHTDKHRENILPDSRIDSLVVRKKRLKGARDALPKGSITQSEFWLVDEESYLGRIRIWHEPHGRRPAIATHIHFEIPDEMRLRGLGTKLLALGLKKAKEFGIDPVLAGCEATNYPARNIIERNGGELLRVVRVQSHERRVKLRVYEFWLSESPQVVL